MTPSKNLAIQTALTGDWNTAITLNQAILKETPNDIETLNRLALAFTVIGKTKEAKRTYKKVLELDNQNPIALKNVKRLNSLNKSDSGSGYSPHIGQNIGSMFLEESGKTKVLELINVAEPKIICHLMTGEILKLHIKRLKIFVLDEKNQYIGMLPDDIGKRLIKFLNGGNLYETVIKSVVNHKVIVFIKEIKKSTKFKNQSSFPSTEKTKITISSKQYKTEKEDEDNSIEESEDLV